MGRRLLALVIDWVLCYLIVSALTHHSVTKVTDSAYLAAQYWTILAFFAETYLLTAVSGLTVGKRLLRMRVTRTSGARPGFGWALLRTILLLCVIPALIADRDLRGLHDRAADTVVVQFLPLSAVALAQPRRTAGARAKRVTACAGGASGRSSGSGPSASAGLAGAP